MTPNNGKIIPGKKYEVAQRQGRCPQYKQITIHTRVPRRAGNSIASLFFTDRGPLLGCIHRLAEYTLGAQRCQEFFDLVRVLDDDEVLVCVYSDGVHAGVEPRYRRQLTSRGGVVGAKKEKI